MPARKEEQCAPGDVGQCSPDQGILPPVRTDNQNPRIASTPGQKSGHPLGELNLMFVRKGDVHCLGRSGFLPPRPFSRASTTNQSSNFLPSGSRAPALPPVLVPGCRPIRVRPPPPARHSCLRAESRRHDHLQQGAGIRFLSAGLPQPSSTSTTVRARRNPADFTACSARFIAPRMCPAS